jgi:hypothetical protein
MWINLGLEIKKTLALNHHARDSTRRIVIALSCGSRRDASANSKTCYAQSQRVSNHANRRQRHGRRGNDR